MHVERNAKDVEEQCRYEGDTEFYFPRDRFMSEKMGSNQLSINRTDVDRPEINSKLSSTAPSDPALNFLRPTEVSPSSADKPAAWE